MSDNVLTDEQVYELLMESLAAVQAVQAGTATPGALRDLEDRLIAAVTDGCPADRTPRCAANRSEADRRAQGAAGRR